MKREGRAIGEEEISVRNDEMRDRGKERLREAMGQRKGWK